jgi:hypothetical protein
MTFNVPPRAFHLWQQKFLEGMNESIDTYIHIVYDHAGDVDKAGFSQYVHSQKIGQLVPPVCSFKRIMKFVSSVESSKLYIIDIPGRLTTPCVEKILLQLGILQDGLIYSKGFFEYIDNPNIIVFTKKMPIFDLNLSNQNKWKYWTVCDNDLVAYDLPRLETDKSNGAVFY